MSLSNPLAITDVFRRHGMATAITAPAIQLQELAMAVSLMGRYEAHVTYQGDRHSLFMEVWQSRATAGGPTVAQLAEEDIRLPRDDRPAPEALSQLGVAVNRLTGYLMEGPLSCASSTRPCVS